MSKAKKQLGFSLIEAVISLVLISFSVVLFIYNSAKLSVVINQGGAKQLAIQQTLSIIERLKVNTTPFYAQKEIAEWQRQTSKILPYGEGKVTVIKGEKVVSVSWGDKQQRTTLRKIYSENR